MDNVTHWLIFLLIPLWGEVQSCPVLCTCQSSQKKLECQTIPNAPILPLTTEFKSVGSPENLTSEIFNQLQPFLVEILDLSHGNIVNVGDDAFVVFGKVEVIDLSQNRIQNLGETTLRGCFLLRKIRLSNNRISKLADNIFSNLPKLQEIYLDHNALFHLSTFMPEEFKILDVSYNKIQNLTSSETRRYLNILDLRGNPIDHIFKDCHLDEMYTTRFVNFPNGEYLKSLRLEHMVDSETFTDLKFLKSLKRLIKFTIVGFQIRSFRWPAGIGSTITHLAFNNITCSMSAEKEFSNSLWQTPVDTLDLSNSSQLARILLANETAWNFLHSLKILVLRSCNLTSLTSIRGSFVPIAVLSIDVSDNPLHCDCELANHLKIKKILLTGKVAHCATPDSYGGRELPSILHLLCPSAQTPTESTTQMKENEETTTPVNTDETAKSANHTIYYIVLVVLTIAISTLIFFVIFFYAWRKFQHSVIERGTALFTVNPNNLHNDSLL